MGAVSFSEEVNVLHKHAIFKQSFDSALTSLSNQMHQVPNCVRLFSDNKC